MDAWTIVAALATTVAALAGIAWRQAQARIRDAKAENRSLREALASVSSDRDSYRIEAKEAKEELAARESQLAEFYKAEADRAKCDLRTMSALIGLTPEQIRQLATSHEDSSRRARARVTELDHRGQ